MATQTAKKRKSRAVQVESQQRAPRARRTTRGKRRGRGMSRRRGKRRRRSRTRRMRGRKRRRREGRAFRMQNKKTKARRKRRQMTRLIAARLGARTRESWMSTSRPRSCVGRIQPWHLGMRRCRLMRCRRSWICWSSSTRISRRKLSRWSF